jgi:hypothetical protein
VWELGSWPYRESRLVIFSYVPSFIFVVSYYLNLHSYKCLYIVVYYIYLVLAHVYLMYALNGTFRINISSMCVLLSTLHFYVKFRDFQSVGSFLHCKQVAAFLRSFASF